MISIVDHTGGWRLLRSNGTLAEGTDAEELIGLVRMALWLPTPEPAGDDLADRERLTRELAEAVAAKEKAERERDEAWDSYGRAVTLAKNYKNAWKGQVDALQADIAAKDAALRDLEHAGWAARNALVNIIEHPDAPYTTHMAVATAALRSPCPLCNGTGEGHGCHDVTDLYMDDDDAEATP
jgi:hypothetical protein